jgi:hypothetical protein
LIGSSAGPSVREHGEFPQPPSRLHFCGDGSELISKFPQRSCLGRSLAGTKQRVRAIA